MKFNFSELYFLCLNLWENKSVLRGFYNWRLLKDTLKGRVIDIGGGKNPDYIKFMARTDDAVYEALDVKIGSTIDFESDQLPVEDNSYDTVLFLNVMEHIYNYRHISREVVRITKSDGQLIGVVPFLMWYHPDPKDYFRYTHESLEKIFKDEIGVAEIKIEGLARGPFTASCQMITQSIPRLIRIPFFILCYLLDGVFLYFRPTGGDRYVLGYYFKITPGE